MIKLSANENCYGCPPTALDAAHRIFKDLSVYPEGATRTLKQALAERYSVHTDNIVTGAGSVRIIEDLIQTFVEQDEEVLTFDNTFPLYRQLAKAHHHRCLEAPLWRMKCRPANLLPFINPYTRLIFIANPNNPTGTIISHQELDDFLKKVPPHIIVAVDEAYAEYATDPSFPDSVALQLRYPNLVILRSFSKIYGLAGLRLGYGIMDAALAAKMNRCQVPFSVSHFAASAAVAALHDTEFIRTSAMQNAQQRNYLTGALTLLGYCVTPSQANFLCLTFGCEADKQELKDTLYRNGILICDLATSGQPLALRITIGTHEVNRKLISVLKHEASLAVV